MEEYIYAKMILHFESYNISEKIGTFWIFFSCSINLEETDFNYFTETIGTIPSLEFEKYYAEQIKATGIWGF